MLDSECELSSSIVSPIGFIKRLNFKPSTSLNFLCRSQDCADSIQVFVEELDKKIAEIGEFLVRHREHGCFFRCEAGEWNLSTGDNQVVSSEEEEHSREDTAETESISDQEIDESFTESQPPSLEIVEDKLPEIDASPSEQVGSEPEGHFTEEEANEDMSDLGGWIKLHRKIIDNPIFKDSFTYHLFSYLLLRANHKPERFLFNGSEISVGRGEFITGIEKISTQTGITPKRIRLRLGILESLNMIARKTTNRFSIITICNYNLYQSPNAEKGQAKGQAELPKIKNSLLGSPGQAKGKQRATNKNDKDIKHYVEGSDELRLASLLLEGIHENRQQRSLSPAKQPDLQSWAKEIDLMIRADGKKPEQIERVIRWCQGNDFWWKNILSTSKLRKQFDRLESETVGKPKGSSW